jgi:hypothetical protein
MRFSPKFITRSRYSGEEALEEALVAAARARVGEGLARNWDELPLVAVRVKRQLQEPEGVGVADLAIGLDGGAEGT